MGSAGQLGGNVARPDRVDEGQGRASAIAPQPYVGWMGREAGEDRGESLDRHAEVLLGAETRLEDDHSG
ncbi:MAG TPA: hypothetical protein VMD59_19115, partial [Acidimicrobiales bacterium]|nr:hypothetical protein [Acidimicrobiales bacterium]